jgi:hypothetical protein
MVFDSEGRTQMRYASRILVCEELSIGTWFRTRRMTLKWDLEKYGLIASDLAVFSL